MSNEPKQEEGLTLESVVSEIHRWTVIIGNVAADILNPEPEKKDLPNRKNNDQRRSYI